MAQSPLAAHQWKDRVLLVFADRPESPLLQTQLERIRDEADGMRDRKLVVYQLFPGSGIDPDGAELSREALSPLLTRFRLGDDPYTVVLVGLDGGEKWRSPTPVAMEELFDRIDSMPMRRSELRKRGKGGGTGQ